MKIRITCQTDNFQKECRKGRDNMYVNLHTFLPGRLLNTNRNTRFTRSFQRP